MWKWCNFVLYVINIFSTITVCEQSRLKSNQLSSNWYARLRKFALKAFTNLHADMSISINQHLILSDQQFQSLWILDSGCQHGMCHQLISVIDNMLIMIWGWQVWSQRPWPECWWGHRRNSESCCLCPESYWGRDQGRDSLQSYSYWWIFPRRCPVTLLFIGHQTHTGWCGGSLLLASIAW